MITIRRRAFSICDCQLKLSYLETVLDLFQSRERSEANEGVLPRPLKVMSVLDLFSSGRDVVFNSIILSDIRGGRRQIKENPRNF